MSRFVQRDADGNLIGHYANPQSYATEEVADDHPDVVAFGQKRAAAQAKAFEEQSRGAMLSRIAKLEDDFARLEKKLSEPRG